MHKFALHTSTHQLLEWTYTSDKAYNDPFNNIELDVLVTAPSCASWKIPAFWRGELRWSVRFIAEEEGLYHLKTLCSDTRNASLHHVAGTIEVSSQEEDSTAQHLHLSVSENKHYLQDANQKPFFWLADTWWMGLSKRLSFPKDFKKLTQDRKEKGFSVIQLVVGLFPDMDHFDERAENEAGLPWEEKYARINPRYFDKADARIAHLVDANLVPCILGAWGYYIHEMGEKKMKQHWRYIIARWGAYPVVWSVAGEGAMPYYLSSNGPRDRDRQIKIWTKIGHYIKKTDPYRHLLTMHPTDSGRTQVLDDTLLDFNMLQAGHSGYPSVENAMRLITEDKQIYPAMPTIMSEVNYEGIMHDTSAEVQRLTFWTSFLSGAAGFSYGANGLWQVNTKELPFGASPHGGTWGTTPWDKVMSYQGAIHIALAKQLLENYPWWQMRPYQEWISPKDASYNYKIPRVAGIASQLRIIYFYGPVHPWSEPKYVVENLEKGVIYKAYFWDPRTSQRYPISIINNTKETKWTIPTLPTFDDWILILEAISTPLENVEKKIFNSLKIKKLLKKLYINLKVNN